MCKKGFTDLHVLCIIRPSKNTERVTGGDTVDLKTVRKAKGLRQTDLALAAGVSHSLIVKIELGERKPSVKVAKRIAEVLDFDWTEFFK